MIKVQNGIASRDQLPAFLQGLAPESLADLTWTDAMLAVQDCAWLPEDANYAQLAQFEKFGAETLTVDQERGVVVVSRAVETMTQQEIDALTVEKASQVRAERNGKLAETVDKINAIRWAAMSSAQQGAWTAYRQALLDVPLQSGFPWTVTWPKVPNSQYPKPEPLP